MKLLPDAIVPPVVSPSPDFWVLLAVILGVAAVTAAVIILLVKRKRRKGAKQ